MDIIHIIAGPIIGAVIGYFTNYIAVKMMFKPLEPVVVFGKTLPFTPGIIPRNKMRLAGAIGRAVGEKLFTEEDLKKSFTDESTKESIAASIYEKISADEFRTLTLDTIGNEFLGEQKTAHVKESASYYISDRIGAVVCGMDIEGMITKAGGTFIREKLNNPMISMFVNDSLIASLAVPAADGIRGWIDGAGKVHIQDAVAKEVDNICMLQADRVVNFTENEETAKKVIGKVYEQAVEKIIPVILQKINITQIVEEKISQMDVMMLENLILSIMKKELDHVVNLGALIGFVIGIINIFI